MGKWVEILAPLYRKIVSYGGASAKGLGLRCAENLKSCQLKEIESAEGKKKCWKV